MIINDYSQAHLLVNYQSHTHCHPTTAQSETLLNRLLPSWSNAVSPALLFRVREASLFGCAFLLGGKSPRALGPICGGWKGASSLETRDWFPGIFLQRVLIQLYDNVEQTFVYTKYWIRSICCRDLACPATPVSNAFSILLPGFHWVFQSIARWWVECSRLRSVAV